MFAVRKTHVRIRCCVRCSKSNVFALFVRSCSCSLFDECCVRVRVRPTCSHRVRVRFNTEVSRDLHILISRVQKLKVNVQWVVLGVALKHRLVSSVNACPHLGRGLPHLCETLAPLLNETVRQVVNPINMSTI